MMFCDVLSEHFDFLMDFWICYAYTGNTFTYFWIFDEPTCGTSHTIQRFDKPITLFIHFDDLMSLPVAVFNISDGFSDF